MNRLLAIFAVIFLFSPRLLSASDLYHVGRSRSPLIPRDSWGVLHTTPELNETDFAPREAFRFFYYSKSRYDLMKDRAYMGQVQSVLQRTGFYCGPIDGVWSDEVSDAIARLQKAHGFRINGALTVSVRRALYLP